MKIGVPITFKLLAFVLPMVCLPIATVGYLSYNDSVKRVTQLLREEQMLRAKVAAAEINTIFESCKMDLETISQLSVLEEYFSGILNHSKTDSEASDSKKKALRLLKDFLSRSSYYYQIRFLGQNGHEFIGLRQGPEEKLYHSFRTRAFSPHLDWKKQESIKVSDIVYSTAHKRFLIHFMKSFVDVKGEVAGIAVIDLDYSKVIDFVDNIKVGERGYAFLVDRDGRTVAHPFFKPYEYNLTKYDDPHLRELVVDMLDGESGWKTYYHMGEKAAAYAPIPAMHWSLAITVPIEEFSRETKSLSKRIVELVLATIAFVVFGVAVLSFNLLRPIRRLATATEMIASGDFIRAIPVNSNDELGDLTRSFNRMVKKLKETQNELICSEKLRAVGRLSAGVAHEIRNPLNVMKGALIYIQRSRKGDELIQEYTQLTLEEIERLNSFVTDFLYFTRQSPLRLILTDVNDLLRNILKLFVEKLNGKRIFLTEDFGTTLPLIPIDPNQMEQVFINLFINAIDAMPEGGHLKVTTELIENSFERDSQSRAIIAIKDNGVGISEKDIQSIFDPFFSTKENGTGLGLPISLRIVENHGGVLRIRSWKRKGTITTVELPVSK
ncbi:MAG: ATP-binding protein [Desulfatiglandaceae bacterium]